MTVPRAIEFVVYGVPQQQGSKNRFGGEDNPRVKGWRQSVAEEASTVVPIALSGPVEVLVEFVFPRPKSHFRTGRYAGELRPAAPYWHTSYPDLDKLQRAIGDALSGVVVGDDSQIARWVVYKRFGKQARAEITVTPLDPRVYESP